MPQPNPQVRDFHQEGEDAFREARQILQLDNLTPDQNAQADQLFERSEELFRRANQIAEIESLRRDGAEAVLENERGEREALRQRAQSAATAAGARAVEQNSDGERSLEEGAEVRGEIDGDQLDDVSGLSPGEREDGAALGEFQALLAGVLREARRNDSPRAVARRRAFQRALVRPLAELTREERQLVTLQEHIETSSQDEAEHRAHIIGSAGSLAILIPPEVQRDVRLATQAFGNWRTPGQATLLSTPHGRRIPIPTINDTNNEGTYEGEEATIQTATDVSAEPNVLGARLVRSGVFKVGYQLSRDMPGDTMERLLIQLGTIRNERRSQRAWTNAAGGFLPKGALEGITSGKTAAAAAAFEQSDFYDLEESVDASYHPMASYRLSNNALTELKKMEGGIGQGLWQPGLAAGQPAQIDGYDYVRDFSMDTVAATNKPVAFGDWSWHYIREVVPTVVIIYREKFAPHIGYELVSENDSRPVNPGVVPFKCMTMASS